MRCSTHTLATTPTKSALDAPSAPGACVTHEISSNGSGPWRRHRLSPLRACLANENICNAAATAGDVACWCPPTYLTTQSCCIHARICGCATAGTSKILNVFGFLKRFFKMSFFFLKTFRVQRILLSHLPLRSHPFKSRRGTIRNSIGTVLPTYL